MEQGWFMAIEGVLLAGLALWFGWRQLRALDKPPPPPTQPVQRQPVEKPEDGAA